MEQIAILSFYSFVNINDLDVLQQKMLYHCKRKMVKGTILLAKEGFNATISGNKRDVDEVLARLIEFTSPKNVMQKYNYSDKHPFSKIKVRLKQEIIRMGVSDIDIDNLKGEYIKPEDWDEFISREDVILIDTRNDYEVHVGTFDGAVDPNTSTFTEFPEWALKNKNIFDGKKIAMYCTGGVRCEKSTAYMKSLGYKDVYHLEGGILQYLEDTGNKNKKWIGDCFVFDDRVAVDSELSPLMIERPDRSYRHS